MSELTPSGDVSHCEYSPALPPSGRWSGPDPLGKIPLSPVVEQTRAPRDRRHAPVRRLMGFRIVSTGSYVPERVVTNEELAQTFGYDADWIVQRTGIVTRHLAAPDEATSDLALRAAQRAIERAGVQAEDIDLLVLATATPDTSGTSSAALVQDRLGLGCQAFDVTAACAGFMYALTTAAQYVVTGCSKLALVIGADTMSRVCNPADQRSAPLFGDGAGAVLLSAGTPQQGFESYALGSDGSGSGYLHRPMGGSRMPIDPNRLGEGLQYMQMDGRAVFKWAIQLLSYNIPAVLEHAGCAVSDMDLFVLHQANERIISAAAENLGLPPERIFMNVQRVGNTTAGSVPLALDEAIAAGRVRPGNRVLLSAFGAGLAWGTAVLRW